MRFFGSRLVESLLIVGISLIVIGYCEYDQTKRVKSSPTSIFCSELEKNGPPADNKFVELTEFEVTSSHPSTDLHYVGLGQNSAPDSSAWIPVFGKGQRAKNESIRVILEFSGVQSEEELEQLVGKPKVIGIVGYGAILPRHVRKQLEKEFPGLDCVDCSVIQVEKRVPSVARAIACIIGGGICLVIFGRYIFWAFYPSSNNYGGDAKVDTTSPDFISKRISTETDPHRFRQQEQDKETLAAEDPEEINC